MGQTMFSKPLAYPSTLDRRFLYNRTSSYVEELWSPIPCSPAGNAQAKADAYSPMDFQRTATEIFLSQAGPRFDLELFQAEHHLLVDVVSGRLPTKKATRFGSPSSGLLLRLRI
jgi:hypothetical protein